MKVYIFTPPSRQNLADTEVSLICFLPCRLCRLRKRLRSRVRQTLQQVLGAQQGNRSGVFNSSTAAVVDRSRVSVLLPPAEGGDWSRPGAEPVKTFVAGETNALS